jgi:hypothetical protein
MIMLIGGTFVAVILLTVVYVLIAVVLGAISAAF